MAVKMEFVFLFLRLGASMGEDIAPLESNGMPFLVLTVVAVVVEVVVVVLHAYTVGGRASVFSFGRCFRGSFVRCMSEPHERR